MSREFFSFDDDYLRRLVSGDPGTEEHFAEYFSVLLRAKLQFRVRSAQDVEDLRQEVFVRVLGFLRNGTGLQDARKLGAFVNAVCNNVVLEHFRGKGRTAQWDDATPEPRENGGGPDHRLLSEELRGHVRKVLNSLSDRDRGLLRAVFLDERDKDAVCTEYGVQRDYLRVLLHRARRRLRDVVSHSQLPALARARTSGGAH
jgi:RNA polymerase sigma-70 factor (ECF subfamily)